MFTIQFPDLYSRDRQGKEEMTQPYRLDDAGAELLRVADVIESDLVRVNAAEIDAKAQFPRENIEALREGGLLGIVSAKEVGATARACAPRPRSSSASRGSVRRPR